MALRLKSISKINAKSAINENITIDAKHNDMVKHFKDLQKSIPILKNDLKNLINKYKTLDTKDKSEFEIIMEKNDLRDKINDLKEKINCIVEKEEENKYFLEVGVLLHNYYETMENSKLPFRLGVNGLYISSSGLRSGTTFHFSRETSESILLIRPTG